MICLLMMLCFRYWGRCGILSNEAYFMLEQILKLIGPAKVHSGSERSLHPFQRSHSHDFEQWLDSSFDDMY